MTKEVWPNLLALVGALGGGLVGYCIFLWLANQGLYGIALPGGLLGLGACASKPRSITIAIICGFAALALGLYAEWRFAPFAVDDSLSYFFAHIFDLQPITLIMIVLGAVLGFWCPFRNCLAKDSRSPHN